MRNVNYFGHNVLGGYTHLFNFNLCLFQLQFVGLNLVAKQLSAGLGFVDTNNFLF